MPFACTQTNCETFFVLFENDQVFIHRGTRRQAPPLYQPGLLLYRLAHQTDVRQLPFLFCVSRFAQFSGVVISTLGNLVTYLQLNNQFAPGRLSVR